MIAMQIIYSNNNKSDFTTLMSKQPFYADFFEGVLTNLFSKNN